MIQENRREDQCHDQVCLSHHKEELRNLTYDYLSEELDYIASENLPVVKGL